ncbi:N-acyl-D-amino-acid deacylase family protein [Alicyclobacillus acidoterrestris]|uniref:D-aminoacylase n=1 Tax=Alicyclobacillus acidoterrestris (strain ATCC 49025 / DSM 3922 / CIP 106132 / NCIMB 13137 / GD3B) TaxID=1356854 RepID=T0DP18_ALIAG|nr:D-aminoacylase [Alicyclobacillus acidoterrestris]EPZ53112.1 hypothetical protein N007_18190 [Alicyclobacillus acidoterrestris ATCC 49025]UNO47689.1 D-aminoacylase [Alicyclobacillus acidoterrestris]
MYDVLIRGGMIVDGTGRQRYVGDIGISGNRIEAVGSRLDGAAIETIDAKGLVVCPGFIDVHSHDDLAILHDEELPFKLRQGVTTTIIGNCGHSIAPMPDDFELREGLRQYMEPVLGRWVSASSSFGYSEIIDFYNDIVKVNKSVNVGALVGHGPLRVRVMGFSDARATTTEIKEMQRLLSNAMEAGALGLSLGLMYVPGCYAGEEELKALAETVRFYNGIVTAHIRGEGDLLLPSIREMLEIARCTKVSMHISHLKAVGKKNWGTIDEAIEMIRAARREGIDVTCDAYPYAAGSTTLLSLLPPWVLQGGVQGVLSRLANNEIRRKVHGELEVQGSDWENVAYITGWDRVILVSSPSHTEFEGFSVAEIARNMSCTEIEAYFRLIEVNNGTGTIVIHHMDERDVERVLAFEYTAVGSDGLPSTEGHPHPRLYGTFPRFVSKYVRESEILTLEQAIQKATSFTVDRFKLGERGRIQIGSIADIAIFDYDKFEDVATYEKPKQFTRGLRHVLVNGRLVVHNGTIVGEHPAQFIRRCTN